MGKLVLLPTLIPDEECQALLRWVDSLTIGELQDLKKLYEEKKAKAAEAPE